MITIQVTRNFNLNSDAVREAVRQVYNMVGDNYLDFLKKYPPQKNEDSLYIRGYGNRYSRRQTSEDLGARWTKRIDAGALEMEIGNNASYAPYVQSSELQSEYHRSWWQTDQDAINQYNDLLQSLMLRLVSDYVVE